MCSARSEKPHRVIVRVAAEIQEILPTGENQGAAKHAARQSFHFDGETLDDAVRKLNEYFSFTQHFL